ncbi:MAG: HNH endonuclease [Candidatus Rokubacteria bacterium]|nr:HNH endonuclease [Candidatus Rokubacteria bacterium]
MSRLSWRPAVPRLRHRPAPRPTAFIPHRIVAEVMPISADTRRLVWSRDEGRCRNCGTTQELQFDHIIPKSWGGSSTAENVELLCRTCNLRKGARLNAPPVGGADER